MKYLSIFKGQAYYKLNEADENKTIDQISKDDLLSLLNKCIDDEAFEMDPFDEKLLQNKAHQIIYKNLHQKFCDVLNRKKQFYDEKISLYRSAIDKYKAELDKGNN